MDGRWLTVNRRTVDALLSHYTTVPPRIVKRHLHGGGEIVTRDAGVASLSVTC
jgi:hypothetical protein